MAKPKVPATNDPREVERWRLDLLGPDGTMLKVPSAVAGNLAQFNSVGQVVDSGFKTDQDTETGSDVQFNSILLGDPTVEGAWRIIMSGNNLNFERLESGAWVRKGDVRP